MAKRRVGQEELDFVADTAAKYCNPAMLERLQELRKLKWKVFSVSQNVARNEHLTVIGVSQENVTGEITSRWLQYDGKLYAPPKGKKTYSWNWDAMAARKIAEKNG